MSCITCRFLQECKTMRLRGLASMPANDAGCESYAANYVTLENQLKEALKELVKIKGSKDSHKEFADIKVGKDSYIDALSSEDHILFLDRRTKELELKLSVLEEYCYLMLNMQAKSALDKMPKKEGG